MRKKNPLLKHINIRSLKYLTFLLLSKIKPIANILHLHPQSIAVEEIADKKIITQYFQNNEAFFNLFELNDVIIYAKTGLNIDQKTNKAINLEKNYFKPVIVTESLEISDCNVINLIGIHKGFKHFFHLFFDYFILLFHYLDKHYDSSKKLKILVRSNLNQIQLDLINFLQKDFPNIEFIKVKNNQKIICKKVIHITKKHFVFYNKDTHPEISNIIISFRNFLVKNYQITELKNKKFTYITRNDAALRRIKNEKEILEFLKEFNFEIHSLSNINFKSQIEIFFNSRFIVGAHGAGFTNIMFCQEKTYLLEIFPKNHYDLGYIMLSKISGVIRDELIEDNEYSKQDFTVNIPRFRNKILEIIKAIEVEDKQS